MEMEREILSFNLLRREQEFLFSIFCFETRSRNRKSFLGQEKITLIFVKFLGSRFLAELCSQLIWWHPIAPECESVSPYMFQPHHCARSDFFDQINLSSGASHCYKYTAQRSISERKTRRFEIQAEDPGTFEEILVFDSGIWPPEALCATKIPYLLRC